MVGAPPATLERPKNSPCANRPDDSKSTGERAGWNPRGACASRKLLLIFPVTLLETVFLVHRLPAGSPNLGKRLVKAPKLHRADTGLACHLTDTDAQRLVEDWSLPGRMLDSIMNAHRQVRVFISSTFSDTHAERDHLVSAILPELRPDPNAAMLRLTSRPQPGAIPVRPIGLSTRRR